MATKTLTVVFTDIKGFTERTSSSSRAELNALLDRHEKLLLPVIEHYEGTVIKTIGDAFLLTFESPTNAVLCGLMIQETLLEENAGKSASDRIEVRVAINTGEVELRGSDIFGETVNIAARIEGLTDAGEVFFTHATYLAMNKSEVPTSEVGERRLKGIEEPVRVYRVIRDDRSDTYQTLIAGQWQAQTQRRELASAPRPPSSASMTRGGSGRPSAGALGIAAVALLALGGLGWMWMEDSKRTAHINDLEKAIALATTDEQVEAAYTEWNYLLEEYPDDNALLARVALQNDEHNWWRGKAYEQMRQLVERDPAYADDPEVQRVLRKVVDRLDPDAGPDTEDGKFRAFLQEHFAEVWADDLVEKLYSPSGWDRSERRSAFVFLTGTAAEDRVDPFKFYSVELFGEVSTNDSWNDRTFTFFETYAQEHDGPPDPLPYPVEELPEHMQYFNDETDRVVGIVGALFAEPLRAELEAAAVSDDTGLRAHAWQVLQGREWTTPEMERQHFTASLMDYYAGYTSEWVVEAAAYLGEQDPATIDPTVLAQLATIEAETQSIVDSGQVPDARQEMSDYTRRLEVTQTAIEQLAAR